MDRREFVAAVALAQRQEERRLRPLARRRKSARPHPQKWKPPV